MGQYNRLLPFARLVDAIILYGTRVTAVRSIKFKKTNNFSEHVVLILDGGAYWVKVPTSSLKRLMADSKEKEKTFAKAVKILKRPLTDFYHLNQELSLEYNALLASNALNIPPRADPISQILSILRPAS
ncbi:hypothetical protein L596_006115 [Steinernema carpocapsae]|uniref:Uncharacterized protein n=1 Tax=Steinernema carpocapsae TaxID=34508 RepID=A0A4U8V1D8_STECR|nr:hypothetical protein L596_006115 [Steinernema carpocapsae]